MAEETNDEQEAEVVKKPVSFLVVGIIGIVSAGAGFATPLLLPDVLGAGATKEPSANQELQVDLAEPNGEIAFVPFGESVVHLNDGKMSRYLRVNLTLQVDEAQVQGITELVEKRRIILKDWLLRYLSDLDMDAIRGAAAQNRMRREIMDHFNTTLFPDGYDRIHHILFEEFNIQ